MKQLLLSAALILGLFAPATLSAHDESQHKGKATKGEITSVAGDRFEMKTDKGSVTVTLTNKTKIEHGNQAVDKSHLQAGQTVSVIGTKLPSGELAAKEVLMGTSDAHSGMDHSKMTMPKKSGSK